MLCLLGARSYSASVYTGNTLISETQKYCLSVLVGPELANASCIKLIPGHVQEQHDLCIEMEVIEGLVNFVLIVLGHKFCGNNKTYLTCKFIGRSQDPQSIQDALDTETSLGAQIKSSCPILGVTFLHDTTCKEVWWYCYGGAMLFYVPQHVVYFTWNAFQRFCRYHQRYCHCCFMRWLCMHVCLKCILWLCTLSEMME